MPYYKKEARQIFYFDDDRSKEIKAAGVLPYCIRDGKTLVLMRETPDKSANKLSWSDLGGKTEFCDKCALDTAVREAMEESKSLFTRSQLLELIDENRCMYTPQSKFVLYFAHIDYIENPNANAGDVEHAPENQRLQWHDVKCLKDLHPRMPHANSIEEAIRTDLAAK